MRKYKIIFVLFVITLGCNESQPIKKGLFKDLSWGSPIPKKIDWKCLNSDDFIITCWDKSEKLNFLDIDIDIDNDIDIDFDFVEYGFWKENTIRFLLKDIILTKIVEDTLIYERVCDKLENKFGPPKWENNTQSIWIDSNKYNIGLVKSIRDKRFEMALYKNEY